MGRAIVIIHASELIRKGLVTVLENKFSVRMVCFSKTEELDNSGLWGVNEAVFIVDSNFTHIKSLFPTGAKSYLLIGLKLNENQIKDIPFDYIYSIYESTEV